MSKTEDIRRSELIAVCENRKKADNAQPIVSIYTDRELLCILCEAINWAICSDRNVSDYVEGAYEIAMAHIGNFNSDYPFVTRRYVRSNERCAEGDADNA